MALWVVRGLSWWWWEAMGVVLPSKLVLVRGLEMVWRSFSFVRGMMSKICLDPAPSARAWGVLGSSLTAEAERRGEVYNVHLPMDCRLHLDATRDIGTN